MQDAYKIFTVDKVLAAIIKHVSNQPRGVVIAVSA
jgi:hypothetical protein